MNIDNLNRWIFFYEILVGISLCVSLVTIFTDVALKISGYEINEVLNIIKNILSMISNISISFFGILISMSSIERENIDNFEILKSDEKNIFEKFINVCKDIIKIYKRSEINFKALTILEKLDNIKHQDYYDELSKFKILVRENLLYRVSMNNYLDLITLIFFYFNVVMFFVPYFNRDDIDPGSKKYVDIFLGVLNQIFSVVFSYIAIVCDNVNLLHKICDNISEDLNSPFIIDFDMRNKIEDSYKLVENPFLVIFRRQTDLERDQKMESSISGASFFGNPKVTKA